MPVLACEVPEAGEEITEQMYNFRDKENGSSEAFLMEMFYCLKI